MTFGLYCATVHMCSCCVHILNTFTAFPLSQSSLYDSCEWVVLTLKYCGQPNTVGSQINIFENLPNNIWFVLCYCRYVQLLCTHTQYLTVQ